MLAIGIAALLVIPATALAHHKATGATKHNVLNALLKHYHAKPSSVYAPCELVMISANSWAQVTTTVTCPSHPANVANGGTVLHLVHHRWRWVGAWGESYFPCGRLRIPKAVIRDLHIPCGFI